MKKQCSYQTHKSNLGKAWHFLAHEDSWASFAVDAILVIVLGKYLIFPAIGLLLGTSFPMVAVVSGSMDHGGLAFDSWWQQNRAWYEEQNITKERFQTFYKPNGFKKGDVFVVIGMPISELKVGDIIVYSVPNRSDPIIHRVISKDTINLATKGDANSGQISFERNIPENQIHGKAVLWVPYIGWVKVGLVEIINMVR